MKKIHHIYSSLVMVLIVGILPSVTFAATRTYPIDITGVNETTFAHLERASCPSYDESLCDPLLKKMDGTIIMRTERNGELYLVDTADGVPSVRRYLPNGLYVVDSKYYMVYDGFKIRLKKGKAFARILRMVQNQGVFPISENDFQLMFTSCENYSTDPVAVTAYAVCVTKYKEGEKIFKKVSGAVIMRVQSRGELYYIDPFDSFVSAAHQLGTHMPNGGESFFSFVKTHAEKTSSESINAMLQGVYY